jgi:hypothetical protein
MMDCLSCDIIMPTRCWYLEKNKLWSQPLYVHQLQNLFYALSNEELDIQLGHFKNTVLEEPIDFFVKTLKKITGVKELT